MTAIGRKRTYRLFQVNRTVNPSVEILCRFDSGPGTIYELALTANQHDIHRKIKFLGPKW